MRPTKKFVEICHTPAVVCSLLLLSAVVSAQTGIGSPTFSTPSPVEQGFVNLANGNLHIEIPLGSFPQRGRIAYTAKLVYDSRIWQPVFNGTSTVWQPTNVVNSQGGWRFVTTADKGTTSSTAEQDLCDDIHTYTIRS